MQLIAPLSLAGAERVVQTQLRNFDNDCFESSVTVFVNHKSPSNDFCEAIEKDGYELNRILLKRVIEWRPIRELIDLARSQSINLFHSHGHRSNVMGLIASKFLRIPIVSTVHGWSFQGPKMRLYGLADKCALKRCSQVVAVSEDLKRRLSGFGIPPARLIYIPNIVDPGTYNRDDAKDWRNVFDIDEGKFVIGYVGRLCEGKGIADLLEAAHFLKKQGHDFTLLIAGDGPERDNLKKLVNKRRLSDDVEFLGQIKDIASVYQELDILVLR